MQKHASTTLRIASQSVKKSGVMLTINCVKGSNSSSKIQIVVVSAQCFLEADELKLLLSSSKI